MMRVKFFLLMLFFSVSVHSQKINFIEREDWNAIPPKIFTYHIPERITIHHEGTIFNPENESAAEHILKVQKWGMSEARYWSDIPYHFIIDFDGNVFKGRNIFTAGETATTYNPEGHLLITCLGNFEEQEVPEKQLAALINLIVYCCLNYQIDYKTIAAHKDYAETLCPGKNLYEFLQSGYLIKEVEAKITQQQIQEK